jgi:2-oxoglutarate ferredoxin oxidoreductase subunit beta
MIASLEPPEFPVPIGVVRRTDVPTFDALVRAQVDDVVEQRGRGDLHALVHSGDVWEVE